MLLRPSTISAVQTIARRNFGMTAVVLQKATDPIQQLFVDKVREYAKKSRWAAISLNWKIIKY